MAQARPQAVRRVLLLTLLLSLPLLSGCWDTIELNDRGIVSTIGIDRTEEGLYTVWYQILQPVQVGQGGAQPQSPSGGKTPVIPTNLIHGQGRTIEDAARAAQLSYTPRLYYGHLQIIVLHERVARAGAGLVVRWINQSLDRRLSQLLLVTRAPMGEILQLVSPLSLRSVRVVRESMGSKIGGSSTLGAWTEDLAVAGREPIMGIYNPAYEKGTVIRQDESRWGGLALFREDRMVDALPPEDSVPYLLLNGDLLSGPIVQNIHLDQYRMPVSITGFDAKIKRWTEVRNGRIRYRVDFIVRGRISQGVPDLNVYEMEDVHRIEAVAAKQLADRMTAVFAKLQAAQIDTIGVGQLLHGSNPTFWRRVRKNWNEQGFPKVELAIVPKVRIIEEGLVKRHLRTTPTEEEEFGSKPPMPKPRR